MRTNRITNYGWRFALGVTLNIGFVLIEAGVGVFAGSLALVADAGHNLSDVFSILIAWGSRWLASRTPTTRRTYGFRRSTILASLLNAVILYLAVGAIVLESIQRLNSALPVRPDLIVWVAAAGVVVNAATTFLFNAGRSGDLNIRGIFLHMAADTALSFGVVVAGIIIMFTGWSWLDPVVSLFIAAVITAATWSLLRDSVNLALDAVPPEIDRGAVEDYLANIPGVVEVHHLHIWALSTTEIALTAHLVKTRYTGIDDVLTSADAGLRKHFGIDHSTLQVEDGSRPVAVLPE